MKNQWAKLGGVVGILYCLAGFVLIFLGWNGAASNDRVEAQMPYLVSGGIAGLGLVVVGAALIVAYSLRTDRVELKASIDELRRAVAASATGVGVASGASGAAGAVGSGVASGDAGQVLAGTETYHRPGCAVVAGQEGATPMDPADAVAAGLAPCRVCRPDQPAG